MRLISIGSSKSCTIKLASEFVSSYHAEILLMDNGDIFLTDCDSKNGTYVNGKRIQPHVEVKVRRGDKIEFDDVVLNWATVPAIQLPDPSTLKGLYGVGKNVRNKYQLSGDSVSRYHATFKEMKNGKWYISDHSKNGTYINGQRIPSDQDVRITSKDQIICGTVPCPNPVPSSSITKTLAYTCCAVVLAVFAVFGGKSVIDILSNDIDPVKATAMVRQTYNIKVVFDDDRVKDVLGIDGWYIGVDEDNEPKLVGGIDNAVLWSHTGTAFFVSNDGLMMTNRHVTDAIWADEHYSDGDRNNSFKAIVNIQRIYVASFLKNSTYNNLTYSTVDLWEKSSFHLEVTNSRFAVLYPGRAYSSYSEADYASVVDQSSNDEIDIALLRLNSNKTPDFCHYFDLKKAIVDKSDMKMDTDYYTVGFPAGLSVATNMTDDNKIEAFSGILHLSRKPSRYTLLFQGDQTVGGQSGSPIYDKDKHLVGVLWGGLTPVQTTTACPISYGIDMVKEHLNLK